MIDHMFLVRPWAPAGQCGSCSLPKAAHPPITFGEPEADSWAKTAVLLDGRLIGTIGRYRRIDAVYPWRAMPRSAVRSSSINFKSRREAVDRLLEAMLPSCQNHHEYRSWCKDCRAALARLA